MHGAHARSCYVCTCAPEVWDHNTRPASGGHDQSAADINTFSRIMEQMDRLRRYFVHGSFEVV